PARRQSPRNGKADHPGADDGDIRLSDIRYGLVRQPAAPFAGMTQTGSMGVISAASARHPRPSNLMMGIPARLHKAIRGIVRCRSRREVLNTGSGDAASGGNRPPLSTAV